MLTFIQLIGTLGCRECGDILSANLQQTLALTVQSLALGECPAVASDSDFDITSAYEDAYNNGWNGVFAWKTSGQDDGCGLWLDIQPAIEKMAGICEDKIFPNGKKAV